MSLKKRVSNIENHYYLSEAEYYGQFWGEFYEADSQAREKSDQMHKLVEESAIEIPFWYMQGKEEHLRRFAWLARFNKKIDTEFNLLLEGLRAFVKTQKR